MSQQTDAPQAQQAAILIGLAKEQREFATAHRDLDFTMLSEDGRAEVERQARDFDRTADALDAGAAALRAQIETTADQSRSDQPQLRAGEADPRGDDRASSWQPIATAPKDGTWILAYWSGSGDPEMMSIVWSHYHWRDQTDDTEDSLVSTPSYWMPLPPAPEEPR